MAFPAYERRFLARLIAREERAYRRFVKDFQGPVFGYCFRMLRSQEDAQDVAQEVFFSAFRALPRFRGDSKVATWIFRIAANHCRNHLKKRKRRLLHRSVPFTDYIVGSSLPGKSLGQAVCPDAILEGKELEALMNRWISDLDQEQREVIILRDLQNLSYEEIALITNTPRGTVKSRIHRARMELKARVEGFQEGRSSVPEGTMSGLSPAVSTSGGGS